MTDTVTPPTPDGKTNSLKEELLEKYAPYRGEKYYEFPFEYVFAGEKVIFTFNLAVHFIDTSFETDEGYDPFEVYLSQCAKILKDELAVEEANLVEEKRTD